MAGRVADIYSSLGKSNTLTELFLANLKHRFDALPALARDGQALEVTQPTERCHAVPPSAHVHEPSPQSHAGQVHQEVRQRRGAPGDGNLGYFYGETAKRGGHHEKANLEATSTDEHE